MDWDTYKVLADQPRYWSNWMLTQCIELLQQQHEAELSAGLEQALAEAPLEVPEDYKGPLRMHPLNLTADQAQRLARSIEAAVEQGLTTKQTAQRGLGGFVEVCREYQDYVSHARV